jgi:hypothetical protein
MNKPAMITSAVVLLLGAGLALAPATAVAGPLADVCGTTVSVDTELDGVTETVGGNCTISVQDAELGIKNSDLTVTGSLIIGGEGTSKLEIKDTTGFVVDLQVSTTTGDLEVKGNNVLDVADSLTIESSGSGNIEVKDNDFGSPSSTRVATGGDCETKGNTPALTCE